MSASLSHRNNFDLIRLLAALQVLVYHAYEHFKLRGQSVFFDNFIDIIHFFPGVPIFFTISGFLIYWSFERNSDNFKQYAINRLLRIYPALWFCLLITCGTLLYFGTINSGNIFSKSFLMWLGCQISFLQFWTPDLLRSFGLSNPNGNLWTITVELQFYFLLPIIFFIIHRFAKRQTQNIVLIAIALASFAANHYIHTNFGGETMVFKLAAVTLFPYLFSFIMGIFIYKNYDVLGRYLEEKALYWTLLYAAYSLVFCKILGLYGVSYWMNSIGTISSIVLSFLIISLAFSKKSLSASLLNGNDISYGVYIYHGVFLNIYIELHKKTAEPFSFFDLAILIILSAFIAVLSWRFIEKPALKFKKSLSS